MTDINDRLARVEQLALAHARWLMTKVGARTSFGKARSK